MTIHIKRVDSASGVVTLCNAQIENSGARGVPGSFVLIRPVPVVVADQQVFRGAADSENVERLIQIQRRMPVGSFRRIGGEEEIQTVVSPSFGSLTGGA